MTLRINPKHEAAFGKTHVEVPALVFGSLAIHQALEENEKFTITHVASGLALLRTRTYSLLKTARVTRDLACLDWSHLDAQPDQMIKIADRRHYKKAKAMAGPLIAEMQAILVWWKYHRK